jgi:hypothetical protein
LRTRTLLTLTGLVSSFVGAVVVYLVLTVPNDLKAGELMKQARKDLDAGNNTAARTSLTRVVQQYPRTDAAAAATVALVEIASSEREKLRRDLVMVRSAQQQSAKTIAAMQQTLAQLQKPVAVPAPIVQPPAVAAPAPKPVAKPAPKKPTAKKPPPKKRTTSRRTRRR